jgi:FkbM family methyltransferase
VTPILVNDRWPLVVPDHRAARPSWPWWEAQRLAAMFHFIRPGDVVYDIGAEEGDFPALFTSWGANVVLAEPNPKAWPNIRATFEANELRPAAWWVGLVSDREWRVDDEHRFGTGDWPDCSYDTMVPDHGFFAIWEHSGVSPGLTFDELVNRTGLAPNVITIDVEGGEGHVLRGAADTLRYIRPLVFCSVHPEFLVEHYGETADELDAFMRMAGYEDVFLCTDHERHMLYVPEERMWPR